MAETAHRLGYRQTPSGKFAASCSCGWTQPMRPKLTHVISDLRSHSAEVVKLARQRRLAFRLDGLSVYVVELQPDSDGVSVLGPATLPAEDDDVAEHAPDRPGLVTGERPLRGHTLRAV